jgi:ABC-type cobalamin/Fe3+-siderophores transport system ATPase subunit
MRMPRTVFLSGPAGSGKTTILRLSHDEKLTGADYENVLIAGNTIHDAIDLNPVIPDLLRLGRVFHLSLDPSEEAVLRRTAGDPDRSPARTAGGLLGGEGPADPSRRQQATTTRHRANRA